MKVIETLNSEYADYCKVNSNDPYSARVVSYGQEWADLMEKEIGEQDPKVVIPKVAEKTSRTADHDGITGFMYGSAVSALAHFWVHGEILRRWHNKETQIGTEGDEANESGGTLNPALINIG